MKDRDRVPSLPIWLIGDSNPPRSEKYLEVPLDARHPARHNIWTPILDIIQDRVYRAEGRRVDESYFFIRNAVECANTRPAGTLHLWPEHLLAALADFHEEVEFNHPKLILSFGSFAFEFCRRAKGEIPHRTVRHWTTERLGDEFKQRTANDHNKEQTLLLPLLHATIARRHYLKSHEAFCKGASRNNYFNYTGGILADWLLKRINSLDIWIKK